MSIPTRLTIVAGTLTVLAGLYIATIYTAVHILASITDDGLGDL